jgi:N-acetylmuramic acid 6-phosphate etherase
VINTNSIPSLSRNKLLYIKRKIIKIMSTTEEINYEASQIDLIPTLEMVRIINQEDAKVAQAVQAELPKIAEAIDAIASRLQKNGRLIYMGAGTSGRLGILDASECPPTYNTPPSMVVACIAGGQRAVDQAKEEAEDNIELGRHDVQVLDLNQNDAVVGIAASGSTPYVLGAIAYAREVGALSVGLACNANTPLERAVQIMIAPLVGPEVINGSTRMKAGTAQKMVLNMLSTGTMIKLGRTFGNLMVDVQATNDKLRRRATRIVQLATGLEENEAATLLQQANNEPKTAIVAALAQITPTVARQRLEEANGIVRIALA